ncbi:TetR/AcrR family transcriptional regulator [Protaetiibacter larvae]|uniref:TetR/AcrR family transcriptional regulator n=1 Tax=Protaetiibacter larvae TaxID=2592654 RepID=UPI00143D6AD9|nr:TetR/AcrR family transcriptional regulator [Protaetiibacter larvae]
MAEITSAAREVLIEKGLEGFTIRAVAERLGAGPMALYTHVASKDELLDLVLDGLLGELVARDDPSRPWDEVVVEAALRLLAHLRAHPWAVTALFARPDPGRGATAAGELYLAAALRGGLDARQAVELFTGLLAFVYGAAGFLAPAARPGSQRRTEVADRIRAAPAEHFPATVAVADELADYGSDAQLRSIVESLVRGVAAGDARRS